MRPPGSRRRRRLPVADLAGTPIVSAPEGTSTRRLIDEALAGAGIEPAVAVETSQREAIVPLVLSGAGTSFLPKAMAAAAAKGGAVVTPLEPALFRTIGIVTRPGRLSPAAAAFVDLAL